LLKAIRHKLHAAEVCAGRCRGALLLSRVYRDHACQTRSEPIHRPMNAIVTRAFVHPIDCGSI
jgi:hypothetical protein